MEIWLWIVKTIQRLSCGKYLVYFSCFLYIQFWLTARACVLNLLEVSWGRSHYTVHVGAVCWVKVKSKNSLQIETVLKSTRIISNFDWDQLSSRTTFLYNSVFWTLEILILKSARCQQKKTDETAGKPEHKHVSEIFAISIFPFLFDHSDAKSHKNDSKF